MVNDIQAALEALGRIGNNCEEISYHLPEDDPDRTGYRMLPDYMTVWSCLQRILILSDIMECEGCEKYRRWNNVWEGQND